MRLHTRMYGHRKRVCSESWLWEKNPLPHRGIEPASAAWWSDAPPSELHPRLGCVILQGSNVLHCDPIPFFFCHCSLRSFSEPLLPYCRLFHLTTSLLSHFSHLPLNSFTTVLHTTNHLPLFPFTAALITKLLTTVSLHYWIIYHCSQLPLIIHHCSPLLLNHIQLFLFTTESLTTVPLNH